MDPSKRAKLLEAAITSTRAARKQGYNVTPELLIKGTEDPKVQITNDSNGSIECKFTYVKKKDAWVVVSEKESWTLRGKLSQRLAF